MQNMIQLLVLKPANGFGGRHHEMGHEVTASFPVPLFQRLNLQLNK